MSALLLSFLISKQLILAQKVNRKTSCQLLLTGCEQATRNDMARFPSVWLQGNAFRAFRNLRSAIHSPVLYHFCFYWISKCI